MTIGYPWIDPNAGFTIQALGGLSAKLWMAGQVPWWNPYMGLGVPLAAEMQPFSLCLPFVLLLQFSNGVFLLKLTVQALAGLATFGLLRQLKLSPMAALTGAIVFEFNGTFAFFTDMPILPIPFLPLLLWGIESAFSAARQELRRGWAFIAIAIAYSLYAGFPESAYLNGLLGLCWAAYRFAIAGSNARWPFARKVAIGGVSGILLSLPILLPFFEYLRLSNQAHSSLTHVGLSGIGLAGNLLPFVFGPIHGFTDSDPSSKLGNYWGATGGYFDLLTLALAFCALFTGKRLLGLRVLLAGWIAIFFARTLNVPFTGDLLKLVPGLDMVAIYRYCQTSCSMAAAVLVALTIQDLWENDRARRRIAAAILSFSAVIVSVALLNASDLIRALLLQDKRYAVWLYGSLLWSAGTIGAVVLLTRWGTEVRVKSVAVLLGVNSVALCLVPLFAGTRHAKVDTGLVSFLQQHIGLSRLYTFGPLTPNYGSYFQIAAVNYNGFPIPTALVDYIHSTMDPGAHPLLFTGFLPGPGSERRAEFLKHLSGFEAAGVRYVLSAPGESLFPNDTEHVRAYRGVVADVWELPHPAPYFESAGGHCRLLYTGREQVDVRCEAADVLIRREFYYPGWIASLNGRSFVAVKQTSVFQAVSVPAGQSSVQFRYRPTNIGRALAGASCGLMMLIAGLLPRQAPKLN